MSHIADPYHVPERVWSLAKQATRNGWEVRIEPGEHQCDVAFWRGDEWVSIGWHITGRRYEQRSARLGHVTYAATDIRLRDVPGILTGRVVLDTHGGAQT